MITNEETVTLTREKYDQLIRDLSFATGMLMGMGLELAEIMKNESLVRGNQSIERASRRCKEASRKLLASTLNEDEEPQSGDTDARECNSNLTQIIPPNKSPLLKQGKPE